MKVTDHMVEDGAGALYAKFDVHDEVAGEMAFAVLSAALADVPEPDDLLDAHADETHARVGAELRVAELEAQLLEKLQQNIDLENRIDACLETLGAIITRLETQADDFAKVGKREGELLAETYRAYAADLRAACRPLAELEARLDKANVPEPRQKAGPHLLFVNKAMWKESVEIAAAQRKRIAELEAQLGKVREWARGHSCATPRAVAELLAILGDERARRLKEGG